MRSPRCLAALLVAASACTVGDATNTGLSAGPDAGVDEGGDPGACEGPLGPPRTDMSGLEVCCQAEGGEGHCLSEVPAEVQPFLGGCAAGGFCVPDQFLRSGGTEPPADCTAFGGPGVCLSRCVPQVAENAGLLQPDVCTGDQLCVPCISPLDGMPTGACDLKDFTECVDGAGGGGGGGEPPPPACDDPATCEYEAGCPAVIDTSTLAQCALDAHCVDAAVVEGTAPEMAAKLARCTDVTKLCVPDVFLRTGGKYLPATCTSVNAAEGRCLSLALPDVAAQQDLLPQATCAAAERCAPCYNPIDGTDTGACRLTCDVGPTQPAAPFAACCEGRARCVPVEAIPDEQEENLDEDDCEDIAEDAYLCVPDQLLLGGPIPTCEASSFILGDYTGVCLSDCLSFGLQGLALSDGDCDDGHKCVPCEQGGEPTGAPGCPEA